MVLEHLDNYPHIKKKERDFMPTSQIIKKKKKKKPQNGPRILM